MDDPYRGSSFTSCPRCNGPLYGDADRLPCPSGCGEWLGAALLEGVKQRIARCEPDVGSLIDRPFPPGRCVICRRTMDVRIAYPLVFDWCRGPGVWLDRGERALFDATFGNGDSAR